MLDEGVARQDLKAVDQAIWHVAAAVLAAHGDESEPFFLTSLSSAWLDRFKITGRAGDVGNAIIAIQRALAVPTPPRELAGRQANLSSALLKRFELRRGGPDLDDAVSAGRTAAEVASKARADLEAGRGDHRDAAAALHAWQASLSNLAAALLSSFEYRQNRSNLDDAILASREVAGSIAPGDSGYAADQANLANILVERFSRFSQVADLEEAFRAAQAGATAAPDDDLARAPYLSAPASAYSNRFAYTGTSLTWIGPSRWAASHRYCTRRPSGPGGLPVQPGNRAPKANRSVGEGTGREKNEKRNCRIGNSRAAATYHSAQGLQLDQ